MSPIPITIITGFLGSGKTTLILNLIPQLPKEYRLALLKNEFGDLAVDSQLASSSAISGVQELLNGCICCNLVGQLGDALATLRNDVAPDRIIIETSGSAFPATLAMEINRLGRDSGHYVLDGVIVVIDVENWEGYKDTSYTAKLQARYTDLVVFNKWEHVDERRYEDCLDRLGDLELQIPNVKSDKGYVHQSILLGLDSALAKETGSSIGMYPEAQSHNHISDHQSEVEVLSVTLSSQGDELQSVDIEALQAFLESAPKDEIYRIKAILTASRVPPSSDVNVETIDSFQGHPAVRYILNWAFGRWNFTPLNTTPKNGSHEGFAPVAPIVLPPNIILRMTIILAQHEAEKWKARIESKGLIKQEKNCENGQLQIERKI